MKISSGWDKKTLEDGRIYAFIADSQLSGTGQNTNSWSSPPGNVYVTYLFEIDFEIVFYMAQLAALSVTQVIEQNYSLGANNLPTIKWPNDVHVNGRKISGVLPIS